jgi:hypothetical protein
MTPEIIDIIGQKTQPRQLTDFCTKLKDLVALSRTEMTKYYDQWDYFDQVYRGERRVDEKDLKARARGEPEKMIIPLTYAQVETFTSFGYSTFNQRDTFYSLIASGQEDEAPAKMATALLEQNLTYNKFQATKLNQFLTDIARFGLGVTKESWVIETTPSVSQVPDQAAAAEVRPDMAQPVAPKMKMQVDYLPKYTGNKIVNVSPYRFFPDVRLPLTRWSEGEFAADEIEESKSEMQKRQKEGLIAGLEHVAKLGSEAFAGRRLTFFQRNPSALSAPTNDSYYLLTEVQIRLNPAETEISEGVFLNPDADCNMLYIVWIANDDRIVKIEEAGYDHEEFGYNVAQFFDDQNRFINLSLCEILSALQDTATWFLNSHITSVRKTMFNQLVADPSGVEIDDIVKRSPVIRLKAGKGGSGVDTWIKQLQTHDATQGHTADVGVLSGYAKEASGISENMLGQFSPGRRSAREAGNVANYAASRLMKILACVWESALSPMGKKMLSNLRQGLDTPTLVRMYGQINTQREMGAANALFANVPPMQQPGVPPMYQMKAVTKADIVGSYDFNVFNGTLPSTRQATASVLMEYLQTAMKDPRITMITQLDPQLMLFEAFELLGIRNVQRFQLTPQRLQQLALMAQPPGNAGGPPAPQGGV